MEIKYSETREISIEQVISLYRAIGWTAADKPQALYNALINSHSLVSAWSGDRLVGIGNAISDGFLVVYYSHLLVLPDFQGKGIGSEIMRMLSGKYAAFHQQILIADGRAIDFYRKYGFARAGKTEPMWIYAGEEH
ncbi:GNAT family N-acetyltransferase [Chloroflexota bacterium]